MKKALFIFITLIITSCNNNGITGIVKDIYGSDFECISEENTTTFILDYSNKRETIENDEIKFCDKIDKFTNSLYDEGIEFAYKSDGNTAASAKSDCISKSREWNTPTIRIMMTTDRCIKDTGNMITIYVIEK